MSSNDIKDDGTINVYKLCPRAGDTIMVVNCGTHYELRYPSRGDVGKLTEQDVDDLTHGRVTWH